MGFCKSSVFSSWSVVHGDDGHVLDKFNSLLKSISAPFIGPGAGVRHFVCNTWVWHIVGPGNVLLRV